jgi:hypothetical protein
VGTVRELDFAGWWREPDKAKGQVVRGAVFPRHVANRTKRSPRPCIVAEAAPLSGNVSACVSPKENFLHHVQVVVRGMVAPRDNSEEVFVGVFGAVTMNVEKFQKLANLGGIDFGLASTSLAYHLPVYQSHVPGHF